MSVSLSEVFQPNGAKILEPALSPASDQKQKVGSHARFERLLQICWSQFPQRSRDVELALTDARDRVADLHRPFVRSFCADNDVLCELPQPDEKLSRIERVDLIEQTLDLFREPHVHGSLR